jgi:hypothetical protein
MHHSIRRYIDNAVLKASLSNPRIDQENMEKKLSGLMQVSTALLAERATGTENLSEDNTSH